MTVEWCAEIGSNHNQSLDRAIELISKAKEIGAHAVKFQAFKACLLYAPGFKNKILQMSKWELPEKFIPEIKKHCDSLNIEFGCSVFDLQSLDLAKKFASWLKIGSYEMVWMPLLLEVINTKMPWMFSTGMTITTTEVAWPVALGKIKNNPPYAILHCNSNYPALPQHCNLSKIKEVKKNHNSIKVGWSDHTRNPELVLNAIGCGAQYVEFHFDLEDGKGIESSIGHCWKPSEVKALINQVRFHESNNIKYPKRREWIYSKTTGEIEASKWRTDPEDGLRPLKRYRKELLKLK